MVFLLLIGLILHLPQPNSIALCNTKPNPNVSRNMENYQINDYKVQWVVDSTLRGDKFPIVIFSQIDLNLTVKTTWGPSQQFSFTSAGEENFLRLNVAKMAWVHLLGTSHGSGSVDLFINNEYHDSYTLNWAEPPAIPNFPSRISYSYRWSSFWVGCTLLEVNLWANGTIQITNKIRARSIAGTDLPLYNSSFAFIQLNAIGNWSEFWQPLDFSEAHKWQSWIYHVPIAIVDGARIEESGILYWGGNTNYNISVTKLKDHSGSGGRPILSHPEIIQFFNLIREATNESVTNYFDQESSMSEVDDPIYAVILTLPILSVIIIAKKRRKMK